MAFIKRDFDNRITLEEKVEPKRVIVIACEDENVQPAYFNAIKDKLEIATITEVSILPCVNGRSAVEHICSNLNQYIEDQSAKYDFDENDEFWIVIDRESPKNVCHKILLEKLSSCEEISSNFRVGVANPLFELWLLLHVADLESYDKTVLLGNLRTGTSSHSKRYIDKELSDLLGGYNKKKKTIAKVMDIIVTNKNIKKAFEQEKLIENDPKKIIANHDLGSNIGTLVLTILEN